MLAWDPPVPIETTASGAPVLVSAAGQISVVVPDLVGSTAADARSVVREVVLPDRRLVAARHFTMFSGLATSAGSRIVVAGMRRQGRRFRSAVLAGAPGSRLKLVAYLPGPASTPIPPQDPATGPGPPLDFFPAGNAPDESLMRNVAVPAEIAGNPLGDIAVLVTRWRKDTYTAAGWSCGYGAVDA